MNRLDFDSLCPPYKPFVNPFYYAINISIEIVWLVAVQFKNNIISIAFACLLENRLKDFALNIIGQFLWTIAPGEGKLLEMPVVYRGLYR